MQKISFAYEIIGIKVLNLLYDININFIVTYTLETI